MFQKIHLGFLIVLLVVSCASDSIALPEVTIYNLTQERKSNTATIFRFQVFLSQQSAQTTTVEYQTIDGTAIAGKDYIAQQGTLSFAPNQISASIEIQVLADSLRSDDSHFFVELRTAKNALLSQNKKATGTIQNTGTYLEVNGDGYQASGNYPNKQLVWSDEFDGKEINPSNWSYDIGGSGWGNNELQYYSNSSKNAFVSNGYLVIEARRENQGTNAYTSARLVSMNKRTFTYGRMDIRARLPYGQGIWPAIWMLGNNIKTNQWPSCGEIDIMELLGHEPNKIYGTCHWGNAGGPSTHIGGNYSLAKGNFSDSFHLFSLQWDAEALHFLVDDVLYYSVQKSQVSGNYPFDSPFFFILNVAVGGNWPGSPNFSTLFPQRMLVDYVRVYQ